MTIDNNVGNPGVQEVPADFNKSLNDWLEMNARKEAEAAQLAAFILMMVNELKGGDVFLAMRIAQMAVMPSALAFVGNQIGVAGTTENVASSVREMVTNIQNLFNSGKDMTEADAKKLIKEINDFADTMIQEQGKPEKETRNPDGSITYPSPLGKETVERLLTGLSGLAGALNGTEGSPFDFTKGARLDPAKAKEMADRVQKWFNPTSGTPTDVPGFNPDINRVTSSLQTMSANVGTVSTTQTANEQYLNNIFNQLQSLLSQMSQTENAQGSLFISNQKAN